MLRHHLACLVVLLAAPSLAQDIRVIDGDTFDMYGEVIRLWGIDAPELDQPCEARPGLIGEIGHLSSVSLGVVLRFTDRCEPLGQSYGRTIARYVLMDGTDAGEIMVERGLAFDYAQFSEGRYAAAQERAQADQVGIWAPGSVCVPPWEWRSRNE